MRNGRWSSRGSRPPSAVVATARWIFVRSSTPASSCSRPAASGVHCQRTCRPGAPSRVSPALGVGRHLGAAAPCALRADARTGRQRGEPERRDHRQSERQECRKGGAGIDRVGYDAGKKVKGKKRHILVDSLGLILTAHWWGSWRSHACNLPGPGKNRRNHCKDLLAEPMR